MSEHHGGESPRSYEADSSPFGTAGERAGELAGILRRRWRAITTELPFIPGSTPHWDDEDRLTFGYLLDLEASFEELENKLGEGHITNRFPAVSWLRASIPYGSGQWDWMKAERNAAWHCTPDEAYDIIKRGGSFPYEELIVRRWMPIIVDGADGANLAARWPATRRGVDWRSGYDVPADPAVLDGAEEALDRLMADLLSS